jgi:lysosomal acid lipase/cholesteryl ester hydrolase
MKLFEHIGVKNMLSFHLNFYDILYGTCSRVNILCRLVMGFFVEDYPTNRIDYEIFFSNFFYSPSGSSARNVNHWVQFYKTKEFRQFDFGKEVNLLKYGQEKPPVYDLEKFRNYKIKSFMTVSNADPFSKREDCDHLFQYLDDSVLTIKEMNNYNHLDYLWSYDAKNDLYYELIDFLKGE